MKGTWAWAYLTSFLKFSGHISILYCRNRVSAVFGMGSSQDFRCWGPKNEDTPSFPLDDDKFPLEFFHLHQIFYTTLIKLSRAVKICLIHELHNKLFSLRYYKRCQTKHTQSWSLVDLHRKIITNMIRLLMLRWEVLPGWFVLLRKSFKKIMLVFR